MVMSLVFLPSTAPSQLLQPILSLVKSFTKKSNKEKKAEDEDDSFFESCERLSSVVPMDLASAGDDDDFVDSRMSFASAMTSASIKRIYSVAKQPPILPSYDMWMSEPGNVQDRRKRLLQDMGLLSRKDFTRLASSRSKIVRVTSRKPEAVSQPKPEPKPEPQPEPEAKSDAAQDSTTKVDSSSTEESTGDEQSPTTTIVLVRSRSDGDIDAFSTKTKQRKEELIGPVSKQKLIRTLSGQLMPTIGVCQYTSAVRDNPKREKNRSSLTSNEVAQSVLLDEAFGSFFLIKNLDTGKDFIVQEYNEDGLWNKLNDVQTGKQLTMEEFEKSVGYSPVVMELMRRMSRNGRNGGGKLNQFSKSFRNSKKAIMKNIKGVATSVSGLLVDKELENSSPVDQKVAKSTSQWVEVHQHGKSYKEFTALHLSQEIQAHEGSIWTIQFSSDGRFLASAGEDKVIHVWDVQECEIMSTKQGDDSSSGGSTPVQSKAGNISDRPPLAEITPMPSEMKRKGRTNSKKGSSIPDYVNMPETVLGLSEKPVCTFEGHQEDVLDLAWSKSQYLLSSSMDKTVRMWELETKSCLKMFAHNDYVTCIQFNPVDEDYFISGSLDAKVRIWSVPERKVVDWTDVHEMVTAACYTPDGQGAIIGCQEGSCRLYTIDDGKLEHRIDIQKKKPQAKKLPPFVPSQAKKLPGFQTPSGPGKITGFQFTPWNPSEVLITSADSRIGIYNESDLVQKFRGFRNTSSQISARFTPDGKHVISASEDSHVYIWKVEETKNPGAGKKRTTVTVQAHENFHCKDVSVAIPWPCSVKNEAPTVEIDSKSHSKRITAPPTTDPASPSREENLVGASGRKHLPPLPKKKNDATLERNTSSGDPGIGVADAEVGDESGPIDPGIGVSESLGSSSASIKYGDSPSISASGRSPSQSWSSSDGGSGGAAGNSQTVQASAWGLAIVTATLEGEIRVYQNFGLPLKVGRQAYLF